MRRRNRIFDNLAWLSLIRWMGTWCPYWDCNHTVLTSRHVRWFREGETVRFMCENNWMLCIDWLNGIWKTAFVTVIRSSLGVEIDSSWIRMRELFESVRERQTISRENIIRLMFVADAIVSDSIEYFRRVSRRPKKAGTTWRTCHCSRTKTSQTHDRAPMKRKRVRLMRRLCHKAKPVCTSAITKWHTTPPCDMCGCCSFDVMYSTPF